MGFWTKRETTHFVRDASGKVVVTEHESDAEKNANREISRWEQRDRERQERRENKQIDKAREKEAYRSAFKEARVERMRTEGKKQGSKLPYENLSKAILGPSKPRRLNYGRPQTKIVYINQGSSKKKKKGRGGMFNTFDPVDNWGLL